MKQINRISPHCLYMLPLSVFLCMFVCVCTIFHATILIKEDSVVICSSFLCWYDYDYQTQGYKPSTKTVYWKKNLKIELLQSMFNSLFLCFLRLLL